MEGENLGVIAEVTAGVQCPELGGILYIKKGWSSVEIAGDKAHLKAGIEKSRVLHHFCNESGFSGAVV